MIVGWRAAALVAAAGFSAPAMAQDAAPQERAALGPVAGEESGPPAAPDGLVASFAVPAHDATGYVTPNRDLGAAETMWHVRVALNVAALGCRGAAEAETVAAYNALLASQKAALAAASDGTAAAYKVRYGAAWQDRFDRDMTKLYNFWAEPATHAAFCAVADAVLRDAALVEPAGFGAFATAALPRLEQPFLAFYAAADRCRTALAGWQAAHAPAIASTAPVQVATAALP